jgi:hypothetical protein
MLLGIVTDETLSQLAKAKDSMRVTELGIFIDVSSEQL